MSVLYHYTCDHGDRGIRNDGALRGNPHPLMAKPLPLIWLTDMDVPDALALGLTSYSIACDRTAHRFEVDTDRAVRWVYAARTLITPARRRHLDMANGARPMHWWVVIGPEMVPVLAEKGDA